MLIKVAVKFFNRAVLNVIYKLFVNSISITSNGTQVRNMSRVKKRFTMPPFWQTKKTRVLYPENVTPRNQEFVDEHVDQQYTSRESILKNKTFEKAEWTPGSHRCGLITKKIGVYPMWLRDGKRILSTLLHVCDNHVVRYIPPAELQENDFKYKRRVQSEKKVLGALVVGAESTDPRLFTKEYFKLFEESGVMPKKRLTKFYITPNAVLPPGMPLYASHFHPGDYVDCTGITIDRGFQGVMKRWGFKGNRATHGTTKSHRRPGNIGGGGGAIDRVWPGTKMPGHMGRNCRTMRGYQIVRVNTKYNVIWIRGCGVPGEIGNYVIMYDTILPYKRPIDREIKHFPTYFPSESETLSENLFLDKLHDFSQDSIIFEEEKKK